MRHTRHQRVWRWAGLTTAKKKAKGKLSVQVTWDAGLDAGSGVAVYPPDGGGDGSNTGKGGKPK